MLSYERPGGMAPPTSVNGADHASLSTARASKSSNSLPNGEKHDTPYHHIWLVSGPAGCGKSTVAQFISEKLNVPYVEGDEFHPKANIDKMAAGQPLTDADRWDWLIQLREEATKKLNAGSDGVVVTCSALKRKYRDIMRVAQYYDHNVRLHFIYLHAPEEVLLKRVSARQGHYMGANMVKSQFGILEPPEKDEMDMISVNVSGTPADVEAQTMLGIKMALQQE